MIPPGLEKEVSASALQVTRAIAHGLDSSDVFNNSSAAIQQAALAAETLHKAASAIQLIQRKSPPVSSSSITTTTLGPLDSAQALISGNFADLKTWAEKQVFTGAVLI